MLSSLARSLLLIAAAAIPAALAKPEQIRAVQSPIFHYYLQAYPEDRMFIPQSLYSSYPPFPLPSSSKHSM